MPFPDKMTIFAQPGKVLGRGIGEGLFLMPRKNNLKKPPKQELWKITSGHKTQLLNSRLIK